MEIVKWLLIFLAVDVAAIILTVKKEAKRRMAAASSDEGEAVDGPAVAEGLLPGSTVRCQDLNALCAVRYLLQREGVETVWDDEDVRRGFYNLYVTKVGGIDDGKEGEACFLQDPE